MKAVLRVTKLKTFGNIGGSNAHCTRTMDVPNADKEREHLNRIFVGTTDMVSDVKNRITENGISLDRLRKDGVLAFEMILSASPEYFEITGYSEGKLLTKDPKKAKQWVSKSMDWLKTEYGKNLVNVHLHLDETTPHFHAIVVPIVPIPQEKQKTIEGVTQTGKLNCKHYLGNRFKLIAIQDSYAVAVADLGIERGLRGSKAKNIPPKQYNAIKEREQNQAHQLALENVQLENQLQEEKARESRLQAEQIEAQNRIIQARQQQEKAQLSAVEMALQTEKLKIEKENLEALKKTPPTYSNLFNSDLPSLKAKEIIPEKAKTNMVGMISKEEHERVIENLKKQFESELKQITGKAGEYILQGYEVLKKEMEEVARWKHAYEMNKRLEANKSQQINKGNTIGKGREV